MKKGILLVLSFVLIAGLTKAQQKDEIPGVSTTIVPVKTETTAELMRKAESFVPAARIKRIEHEVERDDLPQNPKATPSSTFPVGAATPQVGTASRTLATNAQTIGLSFNAATGPTETAGSFPPDVMGAVGPTQFVTFLNGRLRTFNKTTGAADGVLNLDPDVMFASVMTPTGGSVTMNFTTDPRVRYDRVAGRWVLVIIDAPLDNSGNTVVANRAMIAVSNTAIITNATTWSLSYFTPENGSFADYETLGIDANALYIGTNMFTLAGSFSGTNGYVINKAQLYAGGAYTITTFSSLATASGAGPYTPQGVDNFDANATEGYFIGVDNASFGTLVLRRISNPGSASPTISSNISLATLSTSYAVNVPHSGNTNGTGGYLDGLDDRLYAAVIRNGVLWTAHSIAVGTTGVAATSGTTRRNAARWYSVTNLTTTPTVSQAGTVYDNTSSNPRFFHIPTIMVSGQGHAALGMTSAGATNRINAATAGRLSTTATATMLDTLLTTNSSTAYNPPGDPGGSGSSRRWGDYSYISLDPIDDMTLWMTAEYCSGTNVNGTNVTKLMAPPPATASICSPISTAKGQTSVNIVVTGSSSNGSGFYDPGTNLPSPAQPFNHITATVSGGVVVNSVTYTDPTHITININTNAAALGAQTITVTNPDGQVVASATGILTITAPLPVQLTAFNAIKDNKIAVLGWTTMQEQNNKGFQVERSASTDFSAIGFVASNGTTHTTNTYRFTDNAPLTGKNYYRLKQIDNDGKFQYSEIRMVDFTSSVKAIVYPNPFSNILNVSNVPDKTAYQVFNEQGQLVLDGRLINNQINTSKLTKGTYLLQLNVNDEKLLYQLVKN